MAVIATDSTRFSAVVKFETEPQLSICRESVVLNDTAQTLKVGAVLGAYITSPAGASAAKAGNTGNGTMGSITATSGSGLQLGVYKLRIIAAATNAGAFSVTDPSGAIVGYGNVAAAFNAGGLAFTLADGATDFIVGDGFDITVTGTKKYKLAVGTATDGSHLPVAILIADVSGLSGDIVLANATDTKALVLARGPAIVADAGLQLGTGITAAIAKNALAPLGITVETAV